MPTLHLQKWRAYRQPSLVLNSPIASLTNSTFFCSSLSLLLLLLQSLISWIFIVFRKFLQFTWGYFVQILIKKMALRRFSRCRYRKKCSPAWVPIFNYVGKICPHGWKLRLPINGHSQSLQDAFTSSDSSFILLDLLWFLFRFN